MGASGEYHRVGEAVAAAKEAIRGAREAISALQAELKAQEAKTQDHIVATTKIESDVRHLRTDVDAIKRLTDTWDEEDRRRRPRTGGLDVVDEKLVESTAQMRSAVAKVLIAVAAAVGAGAAWLAQALGGS